MDPNCPKCKEPGKVFSEISPDFCTDCRIRSGVEPLAARRHRERRVSASLK